MAAKFNSGTEILHADSGWNTVDDDTEENKYRTVYQLMTSTYANGDIKLTLLLKTGHWGRYSKQMSGHKIAERYRIKGEGKQERVNKIKVKLAVMLADDGYKIKDTENQDRGW